MAETVVTREELQELICDSTKKNLQDHRKELEEIHAKYNERLDRVEKFGTRFLHQAERLEHDQKETRGLTVARAIRAIAGAAHAARNGKSISPVDYARTMFKDGDDSAVLKALLASNLESAGSLIAPQFSSDMIELLREESVVGAFNPIMVDISGGSMTWPKHTGPSTAYYVEEAGVILESAQTTGQFSLVGKKVAALVAISNDLLRNPSVASDQWFRDEMVYTVALRQDLAKIRGDGLENTPRGMRYWAPAANRKTDATNSADTTPTLVSIVTVLSDLWLTLRNGNVKFRRPGLLMAPRTERCIRDAKDTNGHFVWREEMTLRKTIDGIPYRSTTQIPINLGGGSDSELYLTDYSEMLDGNELGIEIDASPDAAYVNSGGTTVAAFPRDLTILRVLTKHDFGAANPEAIAVYTDVQWTTAP